MVYHTPSSHSKNPRHKTFAKGWVAQTNIFYRQFDGGAKILQGSGPKRRESWIANWVYITLHNSLVCYIWMLYYLILHYAI